jgi:hypothetical protein
MHVAVQFGTVDATSSSANSCLSENLRVGMSDELARAMMAILVAREVTAKDDAQNAKVQQWAVEAGLDANLEAIPLHAGSMRWIEQGSRPGTTMLTIDGFEIGNAPASYYVNARTISGQVLLVGADPYPTIRAALEGAKQRMSLKAAIAWIVDNRGRLVMNEEHVRSALK